MSERKKLDLSRPTGLRDFLPVDTSTFRAVERAVRSALERFGFEEIQTPTFEFLDLFLVRSGEKFRNDVFTFTMPKGDQDGDDPGGNEDLVDEKVFVLRPEFTAPVCRFYIQNEISQDPKPIKIYYVGPCFRNDKPAPGRYREFFQVGVEMFGIQTPLSDAQTIIVAATIVKELGIKDNVVRLNDLNILRCLLLDFTINDEIQDKIIGIMDKANGDMIKASLGLIENEKDAIVDAFTRDLDAIGLPDALNDILRRMLFMSGRFDQIAPEATALFAGHPRALDAVATSHLHVVERLLDAAGIASKVVDLSLARGLDYYTGIVFEIDSPSLGKQKQVCGGGRYDGLIAEFGGEPTPATGFAFGLDRLVLAATANGALGAGVRAPRADVFLYAFSDELVPAIVAIQDRFVREGIRVEMNVADWKVKRALQFASKLGFKHAIMLGPKEHETATVVLKNLVTGAQGTVSIDEAIATIKVKD